MTVDYDNELEKMMIPCPWCEETVYVGIPELLQAINSGRRVVCADCKCDFYVDLDILDPRRLTLDEADGELAEVGHKELRTEDGDSKAGQPCPYCKGSKVMAYGTAGNTPCSVCNGSGQV